MQPQPLACPIFRCRPCRGVGMPVVRAIFDLADETPRARFAENDTPNFFPF